MATEDPLRGCSGFEWDEGNAAKIRERHGVLWWECEQAFFLQPFLVAEDGKHSQKETRYFCLGRTEAGRLLFMVFTIRGERIRVISARPMSRRERRAYESAKAKPEESEEG